MMKKYNRVMLGQGSDTEGLSRCVPELKQHWLIKVKLISGWLSN